MKKQTNDLKQRVTAFALVFLFALAGGCTLTGVEDDINNDISEQDLQAASEILGEALSSDNSGLMLSMNDALTTVSSDGFNPTARQKTAGATLQNEDSGRGDETNYSYSYDPETGIHTVSFTRIVDRPLFSKEVTDTLNYIFAVNEGAFIEFPRQERERIESIDYTSYREGNVEVPRRTSSFVRTDTMLIDGYSATSNIMQIDGVHNSRGQFDAERSNGDFMERTYRLQINFLNIEIDKSVAQGNLNDGVTGTLTWEMSVDKIVNGNERSTSLSGTIEMNGDGTALLRFRDYLKIFNVNLNDGDVKDRDREFEGRVTFVDPNGQFFTLRGGHNIYVNDETVFDDDYNSLRAVREALANGTQVWAEGEGYREGNRFIATEVEFEREDDEGNDDGEDGSREFEEYVTTVNIAQNTFTLAGDVIVKIDEQTDIDDGDYQSLEEVNNALNQGNRVVAEGEAVITESSTGADLRALEVSFESDEDDDADTDDSDDEDD